MKLLLLSLAMLIAPVPAIACVDPIPAKAYEVYQSCEAPPAVFTREVTIDPGKGETLAAFLAAKKLQWGDHVTLLPGDHGVAQFKYPIGESTKWTWFDFKPGATAKSIRLVTQSRVLVTGADVQSLGVDLFLATSGSQVVVADSKLTGGDASAWTAAQWMGAPNALRFDNVKCVSVIRNDIKNVRFGTSVGTRTAVIGDSKSAEIKAMIKDNVYDGVSADFIRPLGGLIDVLNNRGTNGKVSAADGDLNHDDFIQLFALPVGVIYEGVRINDNYFQETTDKDQKYKAGYQGISCFDGLYRNVEIKRNTVLASAYHMVSMFGGDGVEITDNKVASIFLAQNRNGWIRTFTSKTGVLPKRVVAKNNVATYFSFPTDAVTENNRVVKPAAQKTTYKEFDLVNFKFDLTIVKP